MNLNSKFAADDPHRAKDSQMVNGFYVWYPAEHQPLVKHDPFQHTPGQEMDGNAKENETMKEKDDNQGSSNLLFTQWMGNNQGKYIKELDECNNEEKCIEAMEKMNFTNDNQEEINPLPIHKGWHVCQIVINNKAMDVQLNCGNTMTVDSALPVLSDFLCNMKAADALVLLFQVLKKDAVNAPKENWMKFTKDVSSLTINGTLCMENLECVLPSFLSTKALTLNRFELDGSLETIGKLFPPGLEKLYYDSRATDNTKFEDNIDALNDEYYCGVSDYKETLKEVVLVVDDFCICYHLDWHSEKLLSLISNDNSMAAVFSMVQGEPTLYNYLINQGFRHSHDGYVVAAGIKNSMEKFTFWVKTFGRKDIVLGFSLEEHWLF